MGIPTLPFKRSQVLEVPPDIRRLQEAGPIHKVVTAVGDPAWLVTRYQEVRELFSDNRLGRSHPDPQNAPAMNRSALFGGGPTGEFETEPEDAVKLRRLLQPLFSAKHMRLMQTQVETLVDGLLDEMEKHGPHADLHQALALPLPVLVICELLGVPFEDREDFQAWSADAGVIDDRARSEAGVMKLGQYIYQLVMQKRANPGDDVLSALANDPDQPDDAEIARLGAGLLFAGHETTVTRIGFGAVALLTNPDQWQNLLDDPELMGTAVEEILRTPVSGTGGIPRYARSDIDFAGVTIKAGDLVILDIAAANHDPSAFNDPDGFDVTTRPANTHVGFGHGLHYCIGAPLARIELRSVFSRLIPRFPSMRLAVPVEELKWQDDQLTGGLVNLPVTWGA